MPRGSSPLARGPPSTNSPPATAIGLIPARAGTTQRYPPPAWRGRAHPRSRGDHAVGAVASWAFTGSSPLARGPLGGSVSLRSNRGLIPARAGTTRDGFSSKTRSRAHPRSRGDHADACAAGLVNQGSSPLARGPQFYRREHRRKLGLIPARAGTTLPAGPRRMVCRAHPRSRGDHRKRQSARLKMPGSSPLARGPHAFLFNREKSPGLIPARAGTTPRRRPPVTRRGAHPRSRGDHMDMLGILLVAWGSSPLARGPRAQNLAFSLTCGLIPARAGTTPTGGGDTG